MIAQAFTAASLTSCSKIWSVFVKPDQAVQISPGDAQAAGSQGLIAIVLANGVDGQFDFIVAKLPLKGAGRMVIANVDDVVEVGILVFLRCSGSDHPHERSFRER